jgi:hypothetical protein
MIKIALRHPSGLEIEFEGDENAFDRFAKFLAGDLGGFMRGVAPASAGELESSDRALRPIPLTSDEGSDGGSGSGQPLGSNGAIDPRAVAAHMEQIGATADIERVTVIAQAAIDASLEGIDYETIERLYRDMGIPKPARFAKAFSNAKTRGLVKSVKHGVWATTVQGENYARYGQKPPRRAVRRGGEGRTMTFVEADSNGGGLSEE